MLRVFSKPIINHSKLQCTTKANVNYFGLSSENHSICKSDVLVLFIIHVMLAYLQCSVHFYFINLSLTESPTGFDLQPLSATEVKVRTALPLYYNIIVLDTFF